MIRCAGLAIALASCGHSVLIAHDDATYRRAIGRYQRARQLVTESLAPDDEQVMFMQAESLFRYRFAPPPRSVGSYFAEVAASVIDLPALEAVAGSLDLYSLRLKTYDGSVQLWETLLERAPATKLRPLALYRLGWAYRNANASGLPRDSDQAFDELARITDSPLATLAKAAHDVAWKSPGAATAWSIVPGLGQLYVGHVGSGLTRLGIALAAAAAIIVPGVIAIERHNDLSWSRDWPLLVTGIVGASVLTLDYTSSYDDALRSVIEYNERTEAEFEAAHADAP
jgi:hypothetical protein